MKLQTSYLLFFTICLSLFKQIQSIYTPTDIFYTQICQAPSSTGTTTCTLATAQSNIVSVGLVLFQYSKDFGKYTDFSTSVSPTSGSASSFTIGVTIGSSSGSMKLKYFLVIIKAQTVQKYIDLIPFSWGSGTNVDNTNSGQRTVSQSIDATTNSIFTTIPSGLQIYGFTTSFTMKPDLVMGFPNGLRSMTYSVTVSISGNMATATLTAWDKVRVSGFQGVMLLFNADLLPTVTWNMGYTLKSFSMGTAYNLSDNSPPFGPIFGEKCFLGFHKVSSLFGVSVIYNYLTNTPSGNYQFVKADNMGFSSDWLFFCLGNGTSCGQLEVYTDPLDLICYRGTTCPLPVYTGYTSTTTCPMCTQLICTSCTVTNRSDCLICGPDSTLTSGICVCNTNYYASNTAIDKSTLGQWNNVANSLTTCLLNCSAAIIGCKQTTCTNSSYCTQCDTGYLLDPISSTNQVCVTCGFVMANCQQCSSLTICTLCDTNYYLKAADSCQLCNVPMSNCLTCTDSVTCLTCDPGFFINSSNLCQCDPIANSLSNCLTCSSATTCTSCVLIFYYLSPTDSLCYLCSNFDANCQQCSSVQQCTLCNVGYIANLQFNGSTMCVLCSSVISNCDQCSSNTTCTNCSLSYGLTPASTCQSCNLLLSMPTCLTCQISPNCLSCNAPTVLLNGVCIYCYVIYNCMNCFVNMSNQLQCSGCVNGFYVDTTTKACKPCMNIANFCLTCSNTQCFGCQFPYMIAPDNTCSLCVPGYELVSGFCTNIAGCQTATKLTNGTVACIACIQTLHYIYDSKLQKCVCIEGYKQVYTAGTLPTCSPVCGDGILLTEFEQCDDKNLISGDGCDQNCKKEAGFQCTSEQPSKCILHLDFQVVVFNYIYRVPGQNKGIMSFIIEPRHPGLQKMAWNRLAKFNFSSTAVNPSQLRFSYSSTTGQLLVTVPYMEQLQNSDLESQITLDPALIVSQTSTFVLNNKLNGVNAPLVFDPELMLSTHQNINMISLVMIVLLLLQFYVGSYFHKMIGLETIQVIQSIYFVRMIASSQQTSILNAMNIIQYSASGYQNSQIIYGNLEQVETNSFGTMSPQFTAIDLKRYYLLNANFSLIPILIAVFVYIICLVRKYHARNKFIEQKQQELKDKYTLLRRSCQWGYDHFIFPYISMFNLIGFFNTILELSSQPSTKLQKYKDLEEESFSIHECMVFVSLIIMCYEIFLSYENYSRYNMTSRQRQRIPKSTIQKLQHDANNEDRQNYHPAYVLVYLIYYFILQTLMVIQILIPNFTYSLQSTMIVSFLYLILIIVWKPYHESISIHNKFLIVYYSTFVGFLAICYVFARIKALPEELYIGLIYVIMFMVGVIMVIGFVRIFFQIRFRKALKENSSLMQWIKQQGQQKSKSDKKKRKRNKSQIQDINVPDKSPTNKQVLVMNNQYAFQNQLYEYANNYVSENPYDYINQKPLNGNKNLSAQIQQRLINKIRDDYAKQRQDIIVQTIQQRIQTANKIPHHYIQNENCYDIHELIDQSKLEPSNLSEQLVQRQKIPLSYRNQYKSMLEQLKSKLRKQWVLIDEQ